jgi:hypothetical protein
MKLNSLKFEKVKVKELYAQLCEGRFAVPKLQRAFVWNGRKSAMLLDSIYRGMPIGSLTIWDTSKRNRTLLRHTLHILPAFKDHNSRIWFVLDGQQRLSVLYQIFIGGEQKNGSSAPVDFNRVVFRVTKPEDQPRFQYRKPIEGEWIPLSVVLASNWRTRLRELSFAELKRVESCRASIQNYQVPLVKVTSENLEATRELFIRINSLGTPLGAADRAFARASRFDLRDSAETARHNLPVMFQGLRYEMFLQTRALLDGITDVGERAFETVAKSWDRQIEKDPTAHKQFSRLWDKQTKAIQRAIDWLKKDFNVLDTGLLPSEYMVSTLAVFFYHRPALPTAKQSSEIKKWFWATSLGQRYSGRGFRDHIVRDAAFFRALSHRKNTRFRFNDRIDPIELQRAVYGKRSSIADALYCLLISHSPAYLANGQPMLVQEYASLANRKHKHHIFPRACLARANVPSNRANSIVNLCFICGEENSVFGSHKPFKYLAEFQSKRYFAKVMKTHLIPIDRNSGLWDSSVDRGYRTFLKARTRLLCRSFEQAAGMKLFRTVGS